MSNRLNPGYLPPKFSEENPICLAASRYASQRCYERLCWGSYFIPIDFNPPGDLSISSRLIYLLFHPTETGAWFYLAGVGIISHFR